jgi:hypothetical protein
MGQVLFRLLSLRVGSGTPSISDNAMPPMTIQTKLSLCVDSLTPLRMGLNRNAAKITVEPIVLRMPAQVPNLLATKPMTAMNRKGINSLKRLLWKTNAANAAKATQEAVAHACENKFITEAISIRALIPESFLLKS